MTIPMNRLALLERKFTEGVQRMQNGQVVRFHKLQTMKDALRAVKELRAIREGRESRMEKLHGVGPKTAMLLRERGYTLESLSEADPKTVGQMLHTEGVRLIVSIEALIANAGELLEEENDG